MQCSEHGGDEDEDEEQREFENKQFEIKFKAEFNIFMKKRQTLETNKLEAYAFLWECCTKGVKNKIELCTD